MVNGKSVARLSLATSNTWKDKNTGEKKEKTEWHRVVIFNEGLVNVVQQYVKKGSPGLYRGTINTRKWKDEKSGLDRYSTEVVLQGFNSSFKILSSKNNQIENLQDNNTRKKVHFQMMKKLHLVIWMMKFLFKLMEKIETNLSKEKL